MIWIALGIISVIILIVVMISRTDTPVAYRPGSGSEDMPDRFKETAPLKASIS